MPTDAAFRLSVYLTLAFACAAVGHAESPLLFEAPIVAGLVIVALGVLYRLETRVELLSIPAANRLGLLLGLGNLIWALFRMLRELNSPQMLNTDWAILGLALIGPLVMTLMPAKLARREKHAGDYWWLHGLALAAAALAGAMAEDFLSFLLIGAYVVCAIWSLSAFSLLRSSGRIQPIPGQENATRIAGVVADNRPRVGFAAPIVLTILAAAVAAPLYLLTPRSTFEKLEFGKPRVEIGFAADQMIDLKQTGDLQANTKVALEVYAETASGPRIDLSPDQRWRGRVLRQYRGGEWLEAADVRLPAVEPSPRIVGQWSPPSLWPGQTVFTYTLPSGSRGRFLADPVAWVENEPTPAATLTPNGYRPWIWGGNGSFASESRMRTTTEPLRYVQVWRPEEDSDLSPPLRLVDSDLDGILGTLCLNPVQKVKVYSDELVERMIADGLLPRSPFDRTSMLPRREFHERIARNFSHHLATTPTLSYSTNLRRERKDLDPIEDFLFHTRSGHCERFATTLVLMLRSQGIPAVLVLGLKGCEPTEEPGRYIVRQEYAHAWVEALIEEYEPVPWWGFRRTSRWLSLDPTPSGGVANATGDGWVQRAGSWLRRMYNAYFVDYSSEQRARALAGIAAAATRIEVLVVIAVLTGAIVFTRRFANRRTARATTSPSSQWFERLLGVLGPYGFVLLPGETAREYATRVADRLTQDPRTVATAEVPLDWAEAYYESRFGGRVLAPDRIALLDSRLEELRLALIVR